MSASTAGRTVRRIERHTDCRALELAGLDLLATFANYRCPRCRDTTPDPDLLMATARLQRALEDYARQSELPTRQTARDLLQAAAGAFADGRIHERTAVSASQQALDEATRDRFLALLDQFDRHNLTPEADAPIDERDRP